MTDTSTTYDELPYSDRAFAPTHPDRLAVVGTLYGASPAPVNACDVLELGCGSGGNLIPMAAALPGSRFVGIDLSARQIDQGRELVERLGLANIELRDQDLMDFDAGKGAFDYILCHGVYSWVPQAVQGRILAICKRGLAPGGLATISYNVYPGWHLGQAVRDIMRYGARGGGSPAEQVVRARDLLALLARNVIQPDSPYGRALRAAAESLADENDTYVFHEYLEACNTAVHFEQFVARAAEAGLRYVGDASLRDPSNQLTDEARRALNDAADDLVHCEQMLDFLRNRTFRRDVLCHDRVPVDRWPRPAALGRMLAAGLAEPVSAEPSMAGGAVEQFRNARGQTLSTADAAAKAALVLLHRARPAGVPFAELLAEVRASVTKADEAALAQFLLACGMASFVELHTHLPPIAAAAGPRPEASPLARWQAAKGKLVVNLRDQSIQLDGLSRTILAMLDGTRDRRGLCEAVARKLRAGELTIEPEPDGPPAAAARLDVPKTVNEVLAALARLALLTG